MSTLYIVNKPNLVEQCQSVMQDSDGLILIEDAVMTATQLTAQSNYFVLEEDLIARGVSADKSWAIKNYDGFVELTLEYDKAVSWL